MRRKSGRRLQVEQELYNKSNELLLSLKYMHGREDIWRLGVSFISVDRIMAAIIDRYKS